MLELSMCCIELPAADAPEPEWVELFGVDGADDECPEPEEPSSGWPVLLPQHDMIRIM